MATRRRGRRARVAGSSPALPDQLLREMAAAGVPDELLQTLDGARDDADLLERIVSLLPSPEDMVAGMLAGWEPLLQPGCDPVSAELAGAELLAMLRGAGADGKALTDVLVDMLEAAEESGKPEALAMSRVLAAVGPPSLRPAAGAAADRLVGAGLVDPAWVDQLGRPKVGACFGYCDPFGSQEVVAITFGYGRKRHGVAVLIDHTLGGGVKDCWLTDQPQRLRAQYRDAAHRAGIDLLEYSPADAGAILGRALAAEPCPVEPDQVEDVATYLDLLRGRVELLDAVPTRSSPRERRAGPRVHRIKIALRGAKPPIWRRLEVPSGTSLDRLHEIVQAAFGWAGYHLWVFSTPIGEYGLPDPELGHADAARKKLSAVAPHRGDRIRYTYDFGDDWEHEILVEEVLDAEPGVAYPRGLAGRRACPPEDCGGVWGYEELLEILADTDHPEHDERVEWLGLDSADDFDPARFDLVEVDASLSRLSRSPAPGT